MIRPAPPLAALATVIIMTALPLAGCCKSNSLVQYKMSDERIDQLIRREFDGVVSLEDRFHTAASMTDWRNGGSRWGEYLVLEWDADWQEIGIPLPSCYFLGLMYSWHEVAVQFDEAGVVRSTQRRGAGDQRDWFYSRALIPGTYGIEDPWKEQSPQLGSTSQFFESVEGGPATRHVSADFPDANRYIGVTYRTYSNTKKEIAGQIQITTNPPVEFVIVDETPAKTHRNRMSGAYIIQNKDYEARSGDMRNAQEPLFDFVPKFVTEYQTLIVLEPHDGVDITVTLVPTEDDS